MLYGTSMLHGIDLKKKKTNRPIVFLFLVLFWGFFKKKKNQPNDQGWPITPKARSFILEKNPKLREDDRPTDHASTSVEVTAI